MADNGESLPCYEPRNYTDPKPFIVKSFASCLCRHHDHDGCAVVVRLLRVIASYQRAVLPTSTMPSLIVDNGESPPCYDRGNDADPKSLT